MTVDQVTEWLKQVGPNVHYEELPPIDTDELRHVWRVTDTASKYMPKKAAALSVVGSKLDGLVLTDDLLNEGKRRYESYSSPEKQ